MDKYFDNNGRNSNNNSTSNIQKKVEKSLKVLEWQWKTPDPMGHYINEYQNKLLPHWLYNQKLGIQ